MTFEVEVTKVERDGALVAFEASSRLPINTIRPLFGTFVGRCSPQEAPRLGARFRLVLVESEELRDAGDVSSLSPLQTRRSAD